ncbi:protein brambleberry isoform X2 [Fopius arisanus]|uniref:Protein brambleberry isoform X2 n=1 Tax=Fopius arisanus TaxID=64838 RepID=A0A9R1SVD4_9HYME|nr:PREDICTED: protein brambleberry-like isoform X2 [Fopius arisanus]
MNVTSLIIVTCVLKCIQASSIFNWIWNKPHSPEDSNGLAVDGISISIPYESMTDDEKFLQEVAKLTHIQLSSPLQLCQHRVIMKIQNSCSTLTEEELAKLGVNLLNCQSAVEGRKIFPCSEDMSLKQCTTDMDADMWNAYHLMSNRARAVCYAARNVQFRALTELTINKLMNSAQSQIQALSSLKESHERLELHTIEAFSSLSSGNKILLEQQKHLENAQSIAHKLVTNNLRQLTNEKALMRSGHTLLASITRDIERRLEKTNRELMDQALEHQEHHQELLKDLMNIRKESQLIWDKIEHSTNRIVDQNADVVAQYDQTLEKLEKINDTVYFIWNVTKSMRHEIDEKLGWITDYIGKTSEQLHKIYRISLHIIYLLAAMVVAAFLNAPFLTRATIIGLIPLNIMTFLKHGIYACLDFTSITILIFFITAMHYVMLGIQQLLITDIKMKKLPQEINIINCNAYGESTPATGIVSITIRRSARFMKSVHNIYQIIIHQLIHLKDMEDNDHYKMAAWLCYHFDEKCQLMLQSPFFWYHTNTNPVEELSCSYLPSNIHREDLITHYTPQQDSTWLSDNTGHSSSGCSDGIYPDLSNWQNENELRHRSLFTRHSPISYSSVRPTESVRPDGSDYAASPPMLCSALTKTGAKCRSRAQPGQNFCARKCHGSSIMSD